MSDEVSRAIKAINEKSGSNWAEDDKKAFAEMIVNGCITSIKNEWYRVNAAIPVADARDTAIRVGTKSGLNKAMSLLRKKYGVNNEILSRDD